MEGQFDAGLISALALSLRDALAVVEVSCEGGRTHHRIVWHNQAFADITRLPAGELRGRDVAALGVAGAAEEIDHLFLSQASGALDTLLQQSGGDPLPVRLQITSMIVDRPMWALSVRERAADVLSEHLELSEERFRVLAEQAPIGIFRSDAGLRLGFANSRCAEILGVEISGNAGLSWLDALLEEDRVRVESALEQVLRGEEVVLELVRVPRPDGKIRWVSIRVAPVRIGQGPAGFVGSVEDLTARKELEDTLAHEAGHDRLTGLPNRSLLWHHLERAHAANREVAVLFLDLDDFKFVNDTLGHEAGDSLLMEVAERLHTTVRPGDLVSRFGGDEFVIVCHDVHDSAHAERIAARVSEAFDAVYRVAGRELQVAASIGLALGSGDWDPHALLRDADVALYQAKGAGKSRVALFDERVREQTAQRLSMATDLRRAIDNGAITVDLQPILDLASGVVVGAEALARWDRPSVGLVSPERFIALAEDTGMIHRLGRWILRASCRQLAILQDRFGAAAPSYMSVNLSVRQLTDPTLVDIVTDALAESRLEGSRLCLELTESVFMDDVDNAARVLAELKAAGVLLAMDDFGTGYSSLSVLRSFPGDLLKMDRSFVSLGTETSGSAIISAVVDVAGAMGLEVVAEGIESAEDEARLRALGCTFGQGYHLGRPMASNDFSDWLRRRPPVGAR